MLITVARTLTLSITYAALETALAQHSLCSPSIWVFPKIRDSILAGPHRKDYSILGLH